MGRYGNPIPTRFLAPIDCLKIPAQDGGEGRPSSSDKGERVYFYQAVRNKKRNIEEGERQLGLEENEEKEWKQIGRVEGL